MGMDALDLARLQFGATTVYHFLFVPLTIGLSPLVAIMQTIWFRTGDRKWFRMTRFFGKLLLIKGPKWIEERNLASADGLLKKHTIEQIAAWSTPGRDGQSVLLRIAKKP